MWVLRIYFSRAKCCYLRKLNCVTEFFFKCTIEYDHYLCIFGHWIRFWHQFVSYTPRSGCAGNFAFLLKIEKQSEQKWPITIFWIFLKYLWTRNPKKHQNEHIMPIFDTSEVFIFIYLEGTLQNIIMQITKKF